MPTCGLASPLNHFGGRCDLSSSGVSAVALHSTCVGLNISPLPSRDLSTGRSDGKGPSAVSRSGGVRLAFELGPRRQHTKYIHTSCS